MFTHLHVHSNFSFRDGAVSIEDLAKAAKEQGTEALAITDHNGLYGAIRFYQIAQSYGIKPIIGTEIKVKPEGETSPHHLILLAKDKEGYSNLCRLITAMHLSQPNKLRFKSPPEDPLATYRQLAKFSGRLFALSGCRRGEIPKLILEECQTQAAVAVQRYTEIYGRRNFLIELVNDLTPEAPTLMFRLDELASRLGLRTVATGNVHYLTESDYKLHDVMRGMREIKTLTHIEHRLNAELYLKTPVQMAKLFYGYSRALVNTGWVADRCNLDLGLGRFRFPHFTPPPGETAFSYLTKLCLESAYAKCRPFTPKVLERLNHELAIIEETGFAEYFLVVWDIVRFAREEGIRCSGRGSAADSLVCFLLGITNVDPTKTKLLFERFLNPERRDMPDIDIDFDSRHRDRVINYIYETYGKDHTAMVCTVSTLRARSAVREVAKVMGYEKEDINLMAKPLPHTRAGKLKEAIRTLPELKANYFDVEDIEPVLDICEGVDGFPRHLSVHLGGVVISRDPLTDLVPLERSAKGVVIGQYDKDDIEVLGLVKMDILGLRMLSAIEETREILAERGVDLDVDTLPQNDPETYKLLRSTKTVGVFQLESPGMRELLGRLQPTRFSDIVANISLFRPGPMQADMITPYIARRHGEAPVSYMHPSLEAKLKPILSETYGVIIYQEQVIEIASALAGFTLGQADNLRRAMTHDRSPEEMEAIRGEFVSGAVERGVSEAVAREVFEKLAAFAAYGFNKAHAAAFGKIAYQTAYLKAHYPAEFLTAILNNMPMGFYPSRVILDEARRLGLEIRPPDVNLSRDRYTLEYEDGRAVSDSRRAQGDGRAPQAIRVGLHRLFQMSAPALKSIVSAQPFENYWDFLSRTKVSKPIMANLRRVGALRCLDVGPREDEGVEGQSDADRKLAQRADPKFAQLKAELELLGLSITCHPLELYRRELKALGVISSAQLPKRRNGETVMVAGVMVSCQTPPTKSGQRIIFVTIEDTGGLMDLTIFERVQHKCAHVVYSSRAVVARAKLRKTGKKGITLIVDDMWNLEELARAAQNLNFNLEAKLYHRA